MSTLTEDIQTFLSLHHRVARLNERERAQYEELRLRVQAALQLPPPEPSRQTERSSREG